MNSHYSIIYIPAYHYICMRSCKSYHLQVCGPEKRVTGVCLTSGKEG